MSTKDRLLTALEQVKAAEKKLAEIIDLISEVADLSAFGEVDIPDDLPEKILDRLNDLKDHASITNGTGENYTLESLRYCLVGEVALLETYESMDDDED